VTQEILRTVKAATLQKKEDSSRKNEAENLRWEFRTFLFSLSMLIECPHEINVSQSMLTAVGSTTLREPSQPALFAPVREVNIF